MNETKTFGWGKTEVDTSSKLLNKLLMCVNICEAKICQIKEKKIKTLCVLPSTHLDDY